MFAFSERAVIRHSMTSFWMVKSARRPAARWGHAQYATRGMVAPVQVSLSACHTSRPQRAAMSPSTTQKPVPVTVGVPVTMAVWPVVMTTTSGSIAQNRMFSSSRANWSLPRRLTQNAPLALRSW